MTSYTDVVSAFESIIKCKYVLADGLVRQWFLNALGEYELNIDTLGFDKQDLDFIPHSSTSDSFDDSGNLKISVLTELVIRRNTQERKLMQ